MKSLKGITVISKFDEADFSNKLISKTTKVNSEQSLNSIHTSPNPSCQTPPTSLSFFPLTLNQILCRVPLLSRLLHCSHYSCTPLSVSLLALLQDPSLVTLWLCHCRAWFDSRCQWCSVKASWPWLARCYNIGASWVVRCQSNDN
jgi:hypothetical protein